jgi:hypothetical protein
MTAVPDAETITPLERGALAEAIVYDRTTPTLDVPSPYDQGQFLEGTFHASPAHPGVLALACPGGEPAVIVGAELDALIEMATQARDGTIARVDPRPCHTCSQPEHRPNCDAIPDDPTPAPGDR